MGKTYLTPKRLYRILHRIADRKIGKVERAFLGAVRVAADEVRVDTLADAIQRGDVRAAIDAVTASGRLSAELRTRMETALSQSFAAASASSAAVVVPGMVAAGVAPVGMALRFDLVNQAAVRHARLRSAKLVQDIDEPMRGFIRRTIAKGIREGVTVRDSGRVIAERLARDMVRTIGLTEQQFASFERASAALAARGLDADTAEARLDRLARKYQRRRGLTIARTETIVSSNAGNLATIRAAVESGLTGVGVVKRWWLVTPDDRLCPICAQVPGMNPDGIGIDAVYQTPSGAVDTPGKVHPQCRCSEIVRVVVQVVDDPLPVAA